MSAKLEKKCINCACFETYTDEKNQVHHLCYKGDVVNIFFFGPKPVGPYDVCPNFVQKTR